MVLLLILFFSALLAAMFMADNIQAFWVLFIGAFIGGTIFTAAVVILTGG